MRELTGTKYCKNCEYFHRDIDGMYCVLPSFDGAYTKNCPKRKDKTKYNEGDELLKLFELLVKPRGYTG